MKGEKEGEGREGVGEGGLLTMGTTLLAPAPYIWKPGFLASQGCGWPGLPALPGEGASWMLSLLPPPNKTATTFPLSSAETSNQHLVMMHRGRSFAACSPSPGSRNAGKAKPFGCGTSLALGAGALLAAGDRQAGLFLLSLRAPSQLQQQPRQSHRPSRTAGKAKPADGDPSRRQA